LDQAAAKTTADDVYALEHIDEEVDGVHDHAQGHRGKKHRDAFGDPHGSVVRAGNDEHEPEVG